MADGGGQEQFARIAQGVFDGFTRAWFAAAALAVPLVVRWGTIYDPRWVQANEQRRALRRLHRRAVRWEQAVQHRQPRGASAMHAAYRRKTRRR